MSINPEELIKKYLDNTCTPEERSIIESWYNARSGSMENLDDEVDYPELEKQIWKKLKRTTTPVKNINWPVIVASAACLLICFLFLYPDPVKDQPQTAISSKILPGSNKAELILADGSILPLSQGKTGILAKDQGIVITQLPEGKLTYATTAGTQIKQSSFNTLRTPKGGQYQLQLPDGTMAWLNAESYIKFPMAFSTTERIVEISGEVYFEVAPNKYSPFKVVSRNQEIEVLGTHFNVSSYPEEMFTKTTLFEGSVKVSSQNNDVIIRPGQQAILNGKTLRLDVNQTDLDEALAWRNGYFQFNSEDIKSIMRKLSRWYDLEVQYTNDFTNQRFSGSVSRFQDADKVLKMLAYTGTIHFKREGRRVTVMP